MRRLGLIVLAVAVLIGLAAVWGLINLQKARAGANNATVVVAARSINLGQSLTPDMLRLQAWPANAIPEGAFTSIADVAGAQPRVALRTIEANEPILATRVSGQGGRATLSATIAPGHRAVAIRVNDVVGVGGFVLPGDYVDVLLTRDESQGYRNDAMRTDLLIANVRVLAVDQSANESENDPQVARAVTIEVTPEDGQKVALGSEIGTMSLALRRADEIGEGATTTPQDTIRIEDLRAEAASARAQPIVARTAAPAPRPRTSTPRPSGVTVEVVRGFTANHTSVASE
ncbi:MAG: Flp pilus assembly protein CpaB [Hyphomonadaceae bacterium]|nr:Flp pilus assembly protein CpaB [Hyphomonadaceae bacterium]